MRSEVYNIDCMEYIKTLPDKCMGLTIADPPFAVKYARGKNGFGITTKNLPTPQDLKWDSKIPDKEFFDELLRVSDRVIIWGGAILYTSVASIEMLACMGQMQAICGRYYMGQVEHIFMLRKGKDKPINDCGKSDLLSIALQRDKDQHGNNIHDSQKPTMLFQVLVAMSTKEGQTVLDPFMGSGTTAIACIKERRHFIGFELSEKYYEMAVRRIKAEQRQMTLF